MSELLAELEKLTYSFDGRENMRVIAAKYQSAFDDRVRVIELQLQDKAELEIALEKRYLSTKPFPEYLMTGVDYVTEGKLMAKHIL